MAVTYSVAISYGKDLGVIEYDGETKSADVIFANDEGKKLVEDYLNKIHEINVPHETLMDFTAEKIDPLENEENLKLALTRLWNSTKVHVDWSRPVDYVKAHPSY
ncbi:MAG: hypothetical protein IKN43_01955 [Selenomonadaceae bacterium]|nr:hypothetical protein [Selenomonadaceae bacterium]